MSVHHFDGMRFVTGREPVRVACRSWTPAGSAFTRPTSAAALLEFAGGLIISYRASIDSPGAPTTWGGEWAMEFASGEAWWTSRGDAGSRLAPERLTIRRQGGAAVEQELPQLRHIDRAGTTDAFARAVHEGREPLPFSSGRDNLKSLAMVEACIRSAEAGGAWVELATITEPATGEERG
jgi:predicted dehydrogenase